MSQPAIGQSSREGGDLDRAIRESLGGRLASAIGGAMTTAWAGSAVRRLAVPSAAGWRAVALAARVRLIALAGTVGMLVHLAMARFGAREPLGAVLPSVVILACGLLALNAEAVARVVERLDR